MIVKMVVITAIFTIISVVVVVVVVVTVTVAVAVAGGGGRRLDLAEEAVAGVA